jgi:site-specific DNA recombinase
MARSLKILLITIDKISKKGGWFKSIRDDFDTSTPTGRFGLQLIGAVAELERELIISRTQDGRRRRALEGKATFRPMFGYRRSESGHLEINPETVGVLRFMFDLADSERLGDNTIQRRLTGRFPAPGGGATWSPSTVGRILTTEAYASGTHSSGIPCPEIIDQQQFDRIQARRKANRRLKRPGGDNWPLQGRMRCLCGGTWRCETPRPGKGRRVYFCLNRYRWSAHVRNGGTPCDIPRQPAELLERSIWGALREALQDPESLSKTLEVTINNLRGRVTEMDSDSEPLRAAVAEIDGERERINDLYRLGEMVRDVYMDRRKDLLGRREGLQDQLDARGNGQLKKLRQARRKLAGAEDLLDTLSLRMKMNLPVDQFSFSRDLAESKAQVEFRTGADYPLIDVSDDHASLSKALGSLMDHLHGQIIIHPDHAEVRGVVGVEVPLATSISTPLHATQDVRGPG